MRVIATVAMLEACSFTPSGPAEIPSDGPRDGQGVIDAPGDDAPDGPDAPPRTAFVIEAESFTAKTDSPTRAWAIDTTIGGFSGAAYMQCGPGTGAVCDNDSSLDTCAASLDYAIAIEQAGTYHVHLRVTAAGSSDDSVWYGLDDTAAPDDISFPQNQQWAWRSGGATFALQPGAHVLTLWQRECGARVDTVAVTDSATPPP